MLELQKLGVVPRTVFLGSRAGEPRSRALKLSDVISPRLSGSRRASFSSVSPRVPGSEQNGSQLTDGLRRQLAAMGPPSSTSGTRSPRPSQRMSPTLEIPTSNESVTLQRISDSVTESSSILERPHVSASPIVSRPGSSLSTLAFIRPPHGLGDAQKALPAVGSIKENAAGHLEHISNLRPRAPTISITSGRSSPVSTAHTIRAEQNMLRSRECISFFDGASLY